MKDLQSNQTYYCSGRTYDSESESQETFKFMRKEVFTHDTQPN